MLDFLVGLVEWVAGLPPWVQVFALMVVAAIPFVEIYFGSVIGLMLGINVWLVLPAVIIGNILATFLLIYLAGRSRDAIARKVQGDEPEEEPSKRRQKIERFLNRFGVPGVMLGGFFTAPSQIVAPILVGIGANRRSVYLWSAIAIILWAIVCTVFWLWLLGAANYPYYPYPQ